MLDELGNRIDGALPEPRRLLYDSAGNAFYPSHWRLFSATSPLASASAAALPSARLTSG